jgi:hypothetical protein
MNYDRFATFSVRIENAVAWVTIDCPPVNIQGLPMLADLNNLAQKLEPCTGCGRDRPFR